MPDPTPFSVVGDTIRLAVAPVFLLTGIAGLLAVMAGRLARIIDRARELGEISIGSGTLNATQSAEANLMPTRITLINWAMLLSVSSALLVCMVIALLFISNLVHLSIGVLVAVIFIAAMVLMIGSLTSLVFEIRLALRLLYIDAETLAAGHKAAVKSPDDP